MKKQYFISLFITCMVIFNVKAQNTLTEVTLTGNPTAKWDPLTSKMSYSAEEISFKIPSSSQNSTSSIESNDGSQNTLIDDFLKKYPYPSGRGVTRVTMSQQMLQTIFSKPKSSTLQTGTSTDRSPLTLRGIVVKAPEAYSSVFISNSNLPASLPNDLKTILFSSKYEQYMEVNKENSEILGYYLKKVNDTCNEIVVLRLQDKHLSVIYIKGEIDINDVERYLSTIKSELERISDADTK